MLDLFKDCNFTNDELEQIREDFTLQSLSEKRENVKTMLDNITNYITVLINDRPFIK